MPDVASDAPNLRWTVPLPWGQCELHFDGPLVATVEARADAKMLAEVLNRHGIIPDKEGER